MFSRCLQEDSAKRPTFSEIRRFLLTQVRLILLLLILDDFWMFFLFKAFSLTVSLGRRFEIRDHVMIVLQLLSCAVQTKKGFRQTTITIYRAGQWLNNICTNANKHLSRKELAGRVHLEVISHSFFDHVIKLFITWYFLFQNPGMIPTVREMAWKVKVIFKLLWSTVISPGNKSYP